MRDLQQRGFEVVALAPRDEATPKLKEMGVSWFDMPMSAHSLNPFSELRTIWATVKTIREIAPDVMFSFTIKPILYGAIASRFVPLRSRLAMITGLGSMFSGSGLLGRLTHFGGMIGYRLALRSADAVVFQNVDHRDWFVDHGMLNLERTTLVNGSGVDLSRFNAEPLPEGPPVFLMTCRIIRSKGIGEFIEAADVIHASHPEARFVLAGPIVDGPGSMSAVELSAMMKGTCVEYIGALSDVRPWLKQASVVVLPTYYPEGVPRILLEALATGRPVVTTDTAGCRTTVQDRVNGVLIEPRNVQALIDALGSIAADPGWAAAMGSASRRLAETRFDVKVVNATIVDRIDQVLKGDEVC